jgi:hypothetical protein
MSPVGVGTGASDLAPGIPAVTPGDGTFAARARAR